MYAGETRRTRVEGQESEREKGGERKGEKEGKKNALFAPPAYVQGMLVHSPISANRGGDLFVSSIPRCIEGRKMRGSDDVLATKSSSIPLQRPSTSAAWMRNSL